MNSVLNFFFKSNFRPIDQRSIISLTSFIDLLQYVNSLKKRNNSRPTSMTSAASKIDGNIIESILYKTLIYFIEVKRSLTVKTPSYAGAKSDQLLIAQIFIDVIGARLNPEVENFRFYFIFE